MVLHVIVGGGFGGLSAARALRGAAVRVTLVDKRNYHLFRPMLSASIAHEINQPLVAVVANGYACLRWLLRSRLISPWPTKPREGSSAMARQPAKSWEKFERCLNGRKCKRVMGV
jgi:flavin-dependent dehydrogenase